MVIKKEWEILRCPFPQDDARRHDSIQCFSVPWIREEAPPGFLRANWSTKSLEEKLRHVQLVVVPHPHFVAAVKTLQDRIQLREVSGKALGMHVIARSNSGKTTLSHYLHALYRPDLAQEVPHRRVVAFSVPNPCKPVDFLRVILRTIQDPDPQGREPELMERVVYLLSALRVEVLLIDNLQDVPTSRGAKGVQQIGAFLRQLIDQTNAVAVLLGTQPAEIVINVYDQIKRRAPARIGLSDYNLDTPKGVSQCLRLIEEFDRALPTPRHSGLATSSDKLGHAIAFASDGEVGAKKSLMSLAVRSSHNAGRECLTREDFSKAYRELYAEYADSCNPFEPGFALRRLNNPGEPHYVKYSDWEKRQMRSGDSHAR
jgi:hypothetical protein